MRRVLLEKLGAQAGGALRLVELRPLESEGTRGLTSCELGRDALPLRDLGRQGERGGDDNRKPELQIEGAVCRRDVQDRPEVLRLRRSPGRDERDSRAGNRDAGGPHPEGDDEQHRHRHVQELEPPVLKDDGRRHRGRSGERRRLDGARAREPRQRPKCDER